MSMIYFTVCTLLFASTCLALRAPAVVYSAIIENACDTPIQCSIVWSQVSGQTLQSGLFTIANKQNYLVNEHETTIDTWKARSIIQEIHCGKLVLAAPFDKVISPQTNWKFIVQSDKIVSVGPNN
ncbi:unnamed protein product [Adineta steineri]|uniref:Uncharacterized protein n=1 Tax=Adineta steineri TaxID=433720 RepID=A0A815NHR4_9BILA|nr:unnamed protein product [Adineta steineri]